MRRKDIPLLATAALLLLLPLTRFVSVPAFSFPVPGWQLGFGLLILVLIAQALERVPRFLYTATAIAAALIVMATVMGQRGFSSTLATLQLLTVVGFIPVAWQLRRQHGRVLLALVMVGILVIHATWGVTQFVQQEDIGFIWLGETSLSASEAGIAKFLTTSGTKVIRAYGPYPHPNILAGSLLMGLLLMLSVFENQQPKRWGLLVSAILFLGLLLTFSRSVWLGLGVGGLVTWWMFHRNRTLFSGSVVLPILLCLLLLAPVISSRVSDPEDRAVSERLAGVSFANVLMSQQPLWRGVGPGNYEEALTHLVATEHVSLEQWQITPVHNVPLLMAVELGVLIALCFFVLVGWLFLRLLGWNILLLTALLPLLLFDHYLWTQMAPQIWLVLLVVLLVPPNRWRMLCQIPEAAEPTMR